MSNIFSFTGKIVLGKDSDKFHPIDRRDYKSGWTTTAVKFNCVSGTNRILCVAQGGKWKKDEKNAIQTLSKSVTDANGKVTRGQTIQIPWEKRFDEEQIDKVAAFRRFTCDTGDVAMRYKLQNLITAFEKQNATEEMIEEVGIDNLADAKEALEKSLAKKKVFLSEWDFAEYVAKVAESAKFKDKLFHISGNYDISYNADSQKFYTTYHVTRVILAADDAVPAAELRVDFFFDENVWSDIRHEETGKYYLNGWTAYYDNTLKKNGFLPLSVAMKEDDEEKIGRLKEKFDCDEKIKEIGLILKVINGAEIVEVTMDMLDEETKADIEHGLLDFEDVKRELGGRVVGERISELRYVKLNPKKNVPQDTMYTIDDMHEARADIFDEDDDL